MSVGFPLMPHIGVGKLTVVVSFDVIVVLMSGMVNAWALVEDSDAAAATIFLAPPTELASAPSMLTSKQHALTLKVPIRWQDSKNMIG